VFNSRSNEYSLAPQFKWLEYTFKETAEIETGMAENSSWDQANRAAKTWFGLEK